MKKLVCFSFVLAVCFFSSCKDDPEFIAKESLITKEKSNIDLFEEKNGAAVKGRKYQHPKIPQSRIMFQIALLKKV